MLKAVGYNPATQTLRAVFNGGRTYDYFEVSRKVYDRLLEDHSKGRYMRSIIINQYPYQEVKKRMKRNRPKKVRVLG
jgi:hypothetical protein